MDIRQPVDMFCQLDDLCKELDHSSEHNPKKSSSAGIPNIEPCPVRTQLFAKENDASR